MNKKILSMLVAATAMFTMSLSGAADLMDPDLQSRAKRATDEGLHFLRGTQSEDGSWSRSVGITALGLRAFLESHREYNESDGAFIERPIAFLLKHVNDDGSISETNQNRNYNTAVAIIALQAANNPEYAEIIANGQKFLTGLQIDEEEGYEADHAYYGGIGYGGDERPDLSNQYMALESLRASSLDPDDPVWEKAMLFVSRSQNRSESNDQAWAGDDGGFTYMPGFSPHKQQESYGGMTHAGLIALLFAGADKSDPRVQAAYDWIRDNYTLDHNPGTPNKDGLFYYYTVFAKCMYAHGEPVLTDTNGVDHNWRNDFATTILALQVSDGFWVNTESGRWWEDNKDLITARMVIALNLVVRAE